MSGPSQTEGWVKQVLKQGRLLEVMMPMEGTLLCQQATETARHC